MSAPITHFILDEHTKGGIATIPSHYDKGSTSLMKALQAAYPKATIERVSDGKKAQEAIAHDNKEGTVYIGFSADHDHQHNAVEAARAGMTTLVLHNHNLHVGDALSNLKHAIGEQHVLLHNGYVADPAEVVARINTLRQPKAQVHATGATAEPIAARSVDGQTL